MRPGKGASVPALSDMAVKPADPRWSDLRTRAASALVLGPIAIFCVWAGGMPWNLLLLVAMAGLGWEWGKLAGLKHPWLLGAGLGLVWAAQVAGGPIAGLLAVPGVWLMARRAAFTISARPP